MSVQLFPTLPWGALVCTWALRSCVNSDLLQVSLSLFGSKGCYLWSCFIVNITFVFNFYLVCICAHAPSQKYAAALEVKEWVLLPPCRCQRLNKAVQLGCKCWIILPVFLFFGFCCFQSSVAMLTLNSLCCWVRLALIFWSSCLYLPWVGIVGVHQHTVPETT